MLAPNNSQRRVPVGSTGQLKQYFFGMLLIVALYTVAIVLVGQSLDH